MNKAEYFERQLKEYREGFERGQYPDAVGALRFCVWNDLLLPEWVAHEAEIAMSFYFLNGGADGRGKRGGLKKQLERALMHSQRHQVARAELGLSKRGETRQEAFERASQALKGKPSFGSAEQIERSYNKVQAQLRDRLSK
jgi:hypothetical protein